MVHNHREQAPPWGRGGWIPVRVTAMRCTGLRSGGPPPEPTGDSQLPWIVIWLLARVGGRGELPTIPVRTGEEVETPEANTPDYTEWVEPEPVVIPRRDIESPNAEPDQTQEIP